MTIDTDLARAVRAAVAGGAGSDEFGAIPVPESYVGAHLRAEDAETIGKLPRAEKRPSLALRIGAVPTPELAPDEVLIATFASSVNYNTVWSAIFEPVPTFAFLKRLAKTHGYGSRHDLPTHVVGSDACGVVLRTGAAVSRWKPGDRVLVHPNYVALEEPQGHDDAILDPDQRVWGFECNFGGMGELCVARGDQLMPKPEHLSWEEAASMPLVNCTAYRMLVSPNGANMQQGDVVLVWGAGGGLGGFALQYVLAGGGYPVCVVSSEAKAQKCREAGAEWIINRAEEDYRFWDAETGQQNPREHLRLGKKIRELSGGRDVDIVFEHPGRDTFGASVFVTRRGGKVVTCASTTGFMHEFDNRYLWMFAKTIVGSHLANYREGWAANELCRAGRTHPILSRTYPLSEAGQACDDVHDNAHLGKVGVLCLAGGEGEGVLDDDLRARHLPAISRFRT
jgi:crotonyl-CoA reductase